MRTLVWFAYFWGYLLCLLPKLIIYNRKRKKGESDYLEKVEKTVTVWARRLMRLAGAEITVTGLENIPKDTPLLFVSNHQGYFDIPLLLGYLDKTYPLVSKKEIGKIPLIVRWMRLFDCVFLDRENPRQSVAALGEAARLIVSGRSVSIFPEGTRAKGRELGEFKGGAFKIASKAKCPILPLVIQGTHKLMEANHYFIRSAKVSLTILPPIYTDKMTKDEFKALPDEVRNLIKNKLETE